MYYGGWGWRPYVSVAQRQAQAMRKIAQLKKKGRVVSPVEIEGRGIATTFWGKAWCENLERYGDYANRLPRGRASTASPSSSFGFTSWTKRNSSAAPAESFLSQGKEEIPGKFCLPAIFLNSSDWILLKAAHAPPHCLQLAQGRTRVRRKCEGASRLSVPAGDSGRDKPSADVFSLFWLLLLACS